MHYFGFLGVGIKPKAPLYCSCGVTSIQLTLLCYWYHFKYGFPLKNLTVPNSLTSIAHATILVHQLV